MNPLSFLEVPEARALLGCLLFAVNQMIVKRLVGEMSVLTVTVWVNCTIAGTALLLSPLGDSFVGTLCWGMLAFVAAGLMGMGMARYTSYASIQTIGVGRTNAILGASPLGAALTAVIFLGERPSSAVWAGTGLIVGGLIVLSRDRKSRREPLRNYLFAALALLTLSLTPYLRKEALRLLNAPWLGIAVSAIVANLFLLPVSRLLPRRYRFRFTFRTAVACLPCGIVSVLGSFCYWTALRDGSLSVIAPLIRLTPLFALLFLMIFYREQERIGGRVAASTVAVVAGAMLVTSGW